MLDKHQSLNGNLTPELEELKILETNRIARHIMNIKINKNTWKKLKYMIKSIVNPNAIKASTLKEVEIVERDGTITREVTKEGLTNHLIQRNSNKLKESSNTPFGLTNLGSQLGCCGTSELAQELNSRSIRNEEILKSKVLSALAEQMTTLLNINTIKTEISTEEFISCYKKVKEKTASSHLGRHIGHYIAALKEADPYAKSSLCSMHTKMMSIPIILGFFPE